jgi:glycosyltransferase involved in cell wall biosynthesis
VEFYYPSRGGAQEVVRHLSERMVKAGHDVTVATSKLPDRKSLMHNGVKIVEFACSGNEVRGMKGEKKKYQEFLKSNKFDVIMNYAAQQWTVDAFSEVMDEIDAVKVFVPCGYSALYDPTYEEYFEKMPDILNKYDVSIYLSDDYRDINFARKHGVTNTVLIPNGADENEFMSIMDEEEKRLFKNRYGIGGIALVTVGNYTGEKGHRELLEVFRKLPVSKATLISAGTLKRHDGYFDEFERQAWEINQSRKHIGKRVVMIDGTDRPTIVQAMKSADIFVFLSNIEASPVVMFEAAASCLPFVATAAGNNKEIGAWLKNGVIVKTKPMPNGRVTADIKSAVWQLTKMARNLKGRQALGQAGRQAWEKNYTWEKIADDYTKLYEKLLKQKKAKK